MDRSGNDYINWIMYVLAWILMGISTVLDILSFGVKNVRTLPVGVQYAWVAWTNWRVEESQSAAAAGVVPR
jgi:hypothetical protein